MDLLNHWHIDKIRTFFNIKQLLTHILFRIEWISSLGILEISPGTRDLENVRLPGSRFNFFPRVP